MTWEILTWENNLLWSPASIWSAIDFYKSLLVGILPVLKQIGFRLIVALVVFFILLFLFNYMSSRWRKKIQKEVLDNLHERNRLEYEKRKNKEKI